MSHFIAMAKDVFHKEKGKLSPGQSALIKEIKEKAEELYALYDEVLENRGDLVKGPPCSVKRGVQQGKDALETSVMWAVKGVTK